MHFDDLNGDERNYYYKIKYFNNWTPSNLFQNEYLKGFDNLELKIIKHPSILSNLTLTTS